MKKIITSKKLFFLLIIISKVRSKLERDKNQMEMVHLACVHNTEFRVRSTAIVIVFSKLKHSVPIVPQRNILQFWVLGTSNLEGPDQMVKV